MDECVYTSFVLPAHHHHTGCPGFTGPDLAHADMGGCLCHPAGPLGFIIFPAPGRSCVNGTPMPSEFLLLTQSVERLGKWAIGMTYRHRTCIHVQRSLVSYRHHTRARPAHVGRTCGTRLVSPELARMRRPRASVASAVAQRCALATRSGSVARFANRWFFVGHGWAAPPSVAVNCCASDRGNAGRIEPDAGRRSKQSG